MEASTTVRMANQIADFFKAYPHEDAVREVATHINRFWEPRMRQHFFALMAAGGAGFDPVVKEAARLVRKPGIAHHEPEPLDAGTGLPRESHEA